MEVEEEAEGVGEGEDGDSVDVSIDEDDLVRVVKTPLASTRSPRLLSYRHGPFDNNGWTTTTATTTKTTATRKTASTTPGTRPRPSRAINNTAVTVRPGRASGPGLASEQRLAQGPGLALAHGQGSKLSICNASPTRTTPTPTAAASITEAHTRPHRTDGVRSGVRGGMRVDMGMGTVLSAGEGVGVGVDMGLGLMDGRQRAWEKRVRTLVDRR